MYIGDVEIRTPKEYPWAYDADWRHKICIAKRDADTLPAVPIPNDLLMANQSRYLAEVEEEGFDDKATRLLMSPGKNSYKALIKANRLYASTGQSMTKSRVEALLLCPEMTYELIATALNTEPEDIQIYERLFFNIRDEEGLLIGSMGLLEYFALRGAAEVESPADHDSYYRKVAIEGGAKALFNHWTWNDPHGDIDTALNEVDMYRMVMPHVYKMLDRRVRFDMGIDGRTLALLVDSIRAAFADLRKNGMLSDSDTVGSEELGMKILQFMQPQMVLPDTAALERRGKLLEDKLESVKQSSTIAEGGKSLDNITAQLNNNK